MDYIRPKKSLRVLVFAITISTGLVFAHPVYRSFRSNDSRVQAKLYRFLVKDRQLFDEYFAKSVAAKVEDRMGISLDYDRAKLGQDTSDLPEDFRNAWERNAKSAYFHLEAVFGDKNTRALAQTEVKKEKPDEFLVFEDELKNVAQSYGIELSPSGHLAY